MIAIFLRKFDVVRKVFALVLAFVFAFNFNFNLYCFSLSVSAKNGAILIDSLTGDVLFEQNADKIAPIASTTKIISTMVVLENCTNLDEPFVVDSKAIQVEGTSMGLQPGDVVTMRDLCYGMMLMSGNDAANAAAVRVAGSVEAFVKLMNDKAKNLGLKNTLFRTPSGLDDVGGTLKKNRNSISREDILKTKMPHSTARELAILTREAMKNTTFKEICASKKAKLCFGNPPYERTLFNHNKLLKFLNGSCCGVKTGFTSNAGRCLVSAARKNGVELIAVVLNDSDDWEDSKNLLNYGFSKFEEYELQHKFPKVKPIVFGGTESEVSVEVERPVKVFLTKSMAKRVNMKIKASNFNFAPIKRSEKLGEVEYYLGEEPIGKANLVSTSFVEADICEEEPA